MNESVLNQPANFFSPLSVNGEQKARVFVTGATGLVGSHLVDELTARGVHVRALSRGHKTNSKNNEKVEWVRGDIFDVTLLEEALENIEQVYHCAGMISYNRREKQQMFATNVEGTANVVNACLN